jgi:drug/metabolite transporter (DMT)-like permease
MFVALTMVPASVYQMMRGVIVLFTALESMIFLGRKIYIHHWFAIILIVLGVAEVGIVAIRAGGGGSTTGSEAFGILLIIVATAFTATQYIIEEVLLANYKLDPMLIVGTEGMWGLLYYLGCLTPMQIDTCGKGYVASPGPLQAMCNFGYLENSAYGYWQMK